MHRVSSNLTIFFKLFIPTLWTVFFMSFTLALYLADDQTLPFLTSNTFRIPFTGIFLLFFYLLYISIMDLKRVEMDRDYYYVSNYFATYRMLYEDIQKIRIIPLGRLKYIVFDLKAKSTFGRRLKILASAHLWDNFLENHGVIAQSIHNKIK